MADHIQERRILVTLNFRDFGNILEFPPGSTEGIVVVRMAKIRIDDVIARERPLAGDSHGLLTRRSPSAESVATAAARGYTEPMNATWAETWERLGRANARAHRDRLRRLTLQEAYSRFEELCRTHTEIEAPPTRRTHAVGLARLWNRE